MVLQGCFLLTGLTFQIIASNLNLYLRHAIDISEQFLFVLATMMASAFFFMAMFYMLLRCFR